MDKVGKWPRYYGLFISGFGLSNLGAWIYLIALNVLIWRLTESPAAVAIVYVIGPLTRIICNFFVGSLIDRANKKSLLLWANVVRALLVFCMLFVDSMALVYMIIICTNIAGTFIGPSSTYMIATHVHTAHQRKFNATNATLSSGAFMIGPAIGGALLTVSSITLTMVVTIGCYLLAALVFLFAPYKAGEVVATQSSMWQTLKADYVVVYDYGKMHPMFVRFIALYSLALMIAFALDSQEMPFLLDTLSISEGLYGVTVTIAGIGAVIGGVCATALTTKFSTSSYIKGGLTFTIVGYVGFYSAPNYTIAAVSFVLLGFFMAFSNSGYATYYQQTVEPNVIGRVTSIVNLAQSAIQVIFTLMVGLLADWFSIQLVSASFAVLALFVSLLLWRVVIVEKRVEKSLVL